MLLTVGPLQWPTDPAGPPVGADPGLWATAVATAVDVLWSRSGRQFGTRAATYRPQGLDWSAGYWDTLPVLFATWGGTWDWPINPPVNAISRRVLELPGPASAVTEVQTVDGAGVVTVVAPAAYRLDGNFLVRVDGNDWPVTQDLRANDGQANTWHVKYSRGNAVPAAGQTAAYLLAVQVLAALNGSKACTLPYNTTTVSRGGVTINRDALKGAKTTGVEAADRWLDAVNPQGLAQPPAIWTPDLPRGGRPYAGSTRPYGP